MSLNIQIRKIVRDYPDALDRQGMLVDLATANNVQPSLVMASAAEVEQEIADRQAEAQRRREETPAPPDQVTTAADLRQRYGIRSMAEILKTDYPPPRWSVPGILPEGLTLLAGAPKVKKSWLALGIGIAIALGGIALGKIPVPQGRVLYLALEDRERRLQTRGRAILAGSHDGPAELDLVTSWKRLDNGGIEALLQYLNQYPETRIVIIDTLSLVRPRKLAGQSDYDADYGAIAMLKNLADKFGVSILVITHTRKLEADDFLDTVLGTHGISGAADGLLVLKRARCTNSAILSITGRDIENEREEVLEWYQPTCSWHLTGKDAAELKLTPERHRIVEILRASATPLSSKQIAERYHGETLERTSGKWRNTRNVLTSMRNDGQLLKDDTGGYLLTPPKGDDTGDTADTHDTDDTGDTHTESRRVTVSSVCHFDRVTHNPRESAAESIPYVERVTVSSVSSVPENFAPTADPPEQPALLQALAHPNQPTATASQPAVAPPGAVTGPSDPLEQPPADCRNCRRYAALAMSCGQYGRYVADPEEPLCNGHQFKPRENMPC